MPQRETTIKKSDFVQSLEKGLRVISAFDNENSEMTLTDVAKITNLTRANARRILLTLEYLGYVHCEDGKLFSLSPRILSLGYSYLSSQSIQEIALPYMKELTSQIEESCFMSVLDGNEIVYVARVQTKRIMTIALGVGTRLPVYATSMGRVLLAGMEAKETENLLDKIEMKKFTQHTLTSKKTLLENVMLAKHRGWAIADEELEIGVRSIACPIKNKDGKTVAALNVSCHASRITRDDMTDKFLPELRKTASIIENALHKL